MLQKPLFIAPSLDSLCNYYALAMGIYILVKGMYSLYMVGADIGARVSGKALVKVE